MKVHALHLPHFHGIHPHLPRLAFSWPHDEGGFEIAVDVFLLFLGALLGLLMFDSGILH